MLGVPEQEYPNSIKQLEEHPSPLAEFESSHCSPELIIPLPHNGVSVWHVEEQPSPLFVLPSSHCSPVSVMEFPQMGFELVVEL